MAKRTEQFAELASLADAVFDGQADAATRARLESLLLESEAARAFYLDYTALHADTAWERRDNTDAFTPAKPQGAAKLAPALSAAGAPIYRKGHEPQPRKFHPHHFAIAAALLVACGVAIYLLAFNTPTDPQPDPSQADPPVATLIETTGGTLTTPHDYPAEGETYGRGEYRLSSGSAEFMLTNAVNVKISGASRMIVRDAMNVVLPRGSAEFVCPKDAAGFTVHLPDKSKIVDLGTAFLISVDAQGKINLRVTEGEVVWSGASENTNAISVRAGQTAIIVDGRFELRADVAIVEFAGITGFSGGDSHTPGDFSSLIDRAGMTLQVRTDPATWINAKSNYREEWYDDPLAGAVSGKLAWVAFDLGKTFGSLNDLYLWNGNFRAGSLGSATFNIYYSVAPIVPLPPPPAANSLVDYDFASGGWKRLNPSEPLTLAAAAAGKFDLRAIRSARYIAIEILTTHGSDPRTGFDEIAITRSRLEPDKDPHTDDKTPDLDPQSAGSVPAVPTNRVNKESLSPLSTGDSL